MNSGMFSSIRGDWATPQAVFDEWNQKEGPFTLDVCATPENAKCPTFFTPEIDGLQQEWRGICWMNPPYGRKIGQWMSKARSESLRTALKVVCLVPARTDTAWWHDIATQGRVHFLRGRLKFNGAKNSAPFPSAIVIFESGGR